jgi:Uma2 family endonuclease
MAMPALLRQFTVDDLDTFPQDGSRYEVLYGVLLVTPQAGFPHQIVAGRLALKLGSVLESEPGVQFSTPGAIQVRPSVHLEPDILIGSWPQVPRWDAVHDHWLAVEVSGGGSRMYDREYKRDAYLQLGVKEVWLVDLDERCVYVSRPGGEKDLRHDASLTWRSPGGRELRIDIPALFRGLPR